MSYVLGQSFEAGGYTIAVVSRQVVGGQVIGKCGVAVQCFKSPAYVVVQNRQGRAVLDMTGAKVALAEVTALCPEVGAL
jgi:hypothetical protein